jgi:acid phosphatase type 7
MTKINNFRAIAPMAAAALATSLLMMTNLLGDPARASTLEATLVGAGDIASCSHHRDRATANVVGNVQGTVFTLGDNVYPDGTAAQFRDCYDPTWGKYKGRTMPSVGNHEYHTQDASGYFGYFGARAGAPSKGYYSYKRGSWRVVVLNSNCSEVVGGCGAHSPQGRWLEQILTNYPSRCTLAYFHHPLFASTGAATIQVRPFWNILYRHNADVILSGHAHYYERFAPQRPDGTKDLRRGIRELVVGTGGALPENPMTKPRADNSVVDSQQAPGVTAYGVLRLRLYGGSYAWKFLPVAGESFTDSGSTSCH